MSQVWHILRKDLRHLRWLLLVWIAILALQVLLSAIGAATAGVTFPAAVVLREITVILPVLQTLMLALLVARLVHEEPLVGWNAFWLTRPYSSRALLGAKLLFIVGVLVLMPLIADIASLAVLKAGPRAQFHAAPSFALNHLIWALGLTVMAVLTPSLAAFVLTIIGSVVTLVVVGLVLFTISFALGLEETVAYDGPLMYDPTPELVATVVFIAAALGVLAYQYRHRRRTVAAALAIAGLAATGIVPTFWPWPFLQPAPPDPGPWARNVGATQPRIDRRLALDIPRDPFETGAPARRRIHAFVELTGVPADIATQAVRVTGRLTLPDGNTLRSRQTESFSRREGTTDGIVLTTSGTPAHAALGGVEILNEVERRGEHWPALLSLTDEEHARHQGKTARFDGTLDFHVYRTSIRATLPIRAGAVVDDGLSRIEVVRAQPIDGGYRVVVRHWRVLPFMQSANMQGYEFFLRNRRERTAVHLGNETSWSGSFAGTSHGGRALSAALGGLSFSSGASGFAVRTEVLSFPWRIQGGVVGAPKLAPEWFQDAELVAVETAYAGFVTRSVTIADFRIPEQ